MTFLIAPKHNSSNEHSSLLSVGCGFLRMVEVDCENMIGVVLRRLVLLDKLLTLECWLVNLHFENSDGRGVERALFVLMLLLNELSIIFDDLLALLVKDGVGV